MPNAERRSVLIIDDERDLAEPLALRLSHGGRYDVRVAFDGLQGLKAAREKAPDLVLLDIAMPGLDGWQVCRRLRREDGTKASKIVFMTAWITNDLGRRAAAEGASRLLLKPFEDRELLEALEGADKEASHEPAATEKPS